MKITFVSYHNWDTKRHGGFHAFAESCAKHDVDTVFFSFSRPFLSYFIQDERKNRKVLKNLSKGVKYQLDKEHELVNVTWPTLAVPYPYRKLIPQKLSWWLESKSFFSFKKFSNKWLRGTDCFVIESNESVFMVDKIRRYFPEAVIVYRPSDPLVGLRTPYFYEPELTILPKVDCIFLVNKEAIGLYKKWLPEFEINCKYTIIGNGVRLSDYRRKYDKPILLKGNKTVTYIGVAPIEWQLVIESAIEFADVDFYVVMPIEIPSDFKEKVAKAPNLHYIPGISNNEVPSWVTNCDVCITPMETGFHERRFNINVTAKDLKAMAAEKPIVAYCINESLKKYGIDVTYSYQDFKERLSLALKEDKREYKIDFREYDWDLLCEKFLETIKALCQQKKK